ncbi:MAG: TRAM domain-containing protein [Vicinamibacterales bacterium]
MKSGERLSLQIERPAVGGRMIARHDGAIVFVAGAIPGETVEAEIEKVQKGVAWATTRRVLEASADRITDAADGACGGCVMNHIRYERQLAIKAAIIEDAFRRQGRLTLEAPVEVVPSPQDGYRMRARLHVRDGRIGFFREGTHELCAAAPTRQLQPAALAAMHTLEQALGTLERETVTEIELAENIDGSLRACHFELARDADPSRLATLTNVAGLTGASYAHEHQSRTRDLWGSPYVSDTIAGATLTRHARAFFQGNRFLVEPLVRHVLTQITEGPVLDLYAGVGLFSVAAAVAERGAVVAVEGDAVSAADLRKNAQPCGDAVEVRTESVEGYLARSHAGPATIVLDPPRTGLSREALTGVVALRAPRMVYVSCDIATLARDARLMIDAGYTISHTRAFDLFPDTAHVETVTSFSR